MISVRNDNHATTHKLVAKAQWHFQKFGTLADFKNGLNFKAAETGPLVKILGVGDFLNRSEILNMSILSDIPLKKNITDDELLKDGDLVFVRSNGNKELVGRCLLVYPHDLRISFSGFTIRARINTDKLLPQFVSLLMQAGLLKEVLKKEGRGTNISNLHQGILSNLLIPLPPCSEQILIINFLAAWNQAIEKTEWLIAAKANQYSWLLTNLISNAKHQRGHIRDFASEVSKRNNGTASDHVLSVTNNRGFVLPEDQFERRVASSDLSNYKIVTRGQYAYNPSRINVGSIARLDDWNKGVLSPMYVVFEIDEKKVNSDFFLHWLESHEAKERIRKSSQGSVRETVSFTDFGAISFPMPSIAEQTKIASILNTAQSEIGLLKKQLEAYRKQKRGLMQKLLTGLWRVKGELPVGENHD